MREDSILMVNVEQYLLRQDKNESPKYVYIVHFSCT